MVDGERERIAGINKIAHRFLDRPLAELLDWMESHGGPCSVEVPCATEDSSP
jgi:hypothetical protein